MGDSGLSRHFDGSCICGVGAATVVVKTPDLGPCGSYLIDTLCVHNDMPQIANQLSFGYAAMKACLDVIVASRKLLN